MEHQEQLRQAISSFLDRFQPNSAAEIARLQDIQANFAAGQSLESQYHNFIAIGDADLLRAFYESAPDFRAQILSNPNCPEDLTGHLTENVSAAMGYNAFISSSSKHKHPLLSLDQEIDLDLKGLSDYEAMLPAGEISGQDQSGCVRRIENLQRLFDRVPGILHETDLTNNETPLFYDLLTAKQRISANLKVFNRLRIGLSNRFAKLGQDKEEDAERSLLDETRQNTNQMDLEPEPEQEPEGPTEEDLEEDAFAAFLAEEEARAAMEAEAAAKKAADQKRQQRLRQSAKEQETRSVQEQRQREEAARQRETYSTPQQTPYPGAGSSYEIPGTGGYGTPPVYPAYESVPPPNPAEAPKPTYDDREEVLRRQEQTRKDDVLAEEQHQHEKQRASREENVRRYRERMDRSYGYESFGKSHIDFSGKEQHGAAENTPHAPDTPAAPPTQEPTAPASSRAASAQHEPNYRGDPSAFEHQQDKPHSQEHDPASDPSRPYPTSGPSYSDSKQAFGPLHDSQQGPSVDPLSYDDPTERNRKHQEYTNDVLKSEQIAHDQAARERRDSAVQEYKTRMDQSYGYQSYDNGHPDLSRKETTARAPFQPYVYTPGGGVSPAFSAGPDPSIAQMSNREIYRAAVERGSITPEMSRAMRDNMAAVRREYEAAKGTPSFQEVAQRYNESRAAAMAINNDIRNNLISIEHGSSPASNSANVSRMYRSGKHDSFTAYSYTPAGIHGTSYEKGSPTGGVIVHNAPGTVGKEVLSREKPLLVSKAYEQTLSRDAKLARQMLSERINVKDASGNPIKLHAAELAAYKTSLDAYEGYRRAKAEGLVKVTAGSGVVNTPDQKAWASRQETYRQTVEQRNARYNRADQIDTSSKQAASKNNRTPNSPDPLKDKGSGPSPSLDPRADRRSDRRPDPGANRGTDPKQNPRSSDVKADPRSYDPGDIRWTGTGNRSKGAPFGSVFSINYNRGKYTAGERETSAKLLNRDTRLMRPGAMRTLGSRMYHNYAAYVPDASAMAGRKLYTMLQASSEAGSQSIRTFEQGRYYGAAGAGIAIAYATRNVGNVQRFEKHAAKIERHNYGFNRELSNHDVSKKLHTSMNDSRALKKDIRQMYEREAGLSAQERRVLSQKIKDHKALGKETSKWAGLHNARVKEKVQKEVLEELHRNRQGYGLVTENALKALQTQRQQLHVERRAILKSQPERAALNKRISELQRKGKSNLSQAELDELRDLRGKLSKLSSDPRLTALDRREQELLKQFKKKPDETSVGLKHIRLKDTQELRAKILRDHDVREESRFIQFYRVKSSDIKANKQLLERQSEVAKRKIKNLLAKSKRTGAEELELRELIKLVKKNQVQIKAHADILNLRNIRDLKLEAVDKVRKTLLKNKQRKRIGKMALVGFMMRPIQEGDNIGAQGLAKGISVGTNPYVQRLVRSSIRTSVKFTKFALGKAGKWTGLDKTLAPAIQKSKEIHVAAKKIINTPKELQKKAIKTATTATKKAASRMTPQFIKTGNAVIRNKLASLAGRLQKSKLGKAYEAAARALSKVKAALGTVAKALTAIAGKVVLILLALILIAGLITVIGGAIAGSVPSFLIVGTESTDDGKIDLTPYAAVYNEELVKFKEDIVAAKTAKNYENVTEICYGPTDYNNIKEVLSMTAVRMSQNLDMVGNPKIEPYIRSLFTDSHIITTKESEPYSCSGCETRLVLTDHNSNCSKNCILLHYTTEKYCPGKHLDLTITITTLLFDEIFTADSKGNADASVTQGDLIGNFTITHYCCEKYEHICNAGPPYKTATGTTPTPGRTIAVDPNVIPLGTHVIINGQEYIAEDTGGAVDSYHIDIAVATHAEALSKGTLSNVAVYLTDYEGEGMQATEGEWNGWVEENREWVKTIYNAPWGDLYEGVDAMGAYTGTWIEYDWSNFEYSDESNLTTAQQQVAYVAKNSANFGIAANAGYCQQWVRLVYSAAGFTGGNAVSANDAGSQWLVSTDWSNIPVGAAVYGYSSSVYGHVGIYVGDGKVYHNVGGVAVDDLQTWVSKYNGYGWGWQGGHELTDTGG